MSEHTKGPWFADDSKTYTAINTDDGKHVAMANYSYAIQGSEHDANARLIAAAPDMYDALKLCVEALTWNVGVEPLPTMELEAITKGRAALDKIEGKS